MKKTKYDTKFILHNHFSHYYYRGWFNVYFIRFNEVNKIDSLSELCMHKDIDLTKHEVHEYFGLPYEKTLPLKKCYDCNGIDHLCVLFYPLRHIKRSNGIDYAGMNGDRK